VKKYTIRGSNSYWTGTIEEIVGWAKEECYNTAMRQRQAVAKRWLFNRGVRE